MKSPSFFRLMLTVSLAAILLFAAVGVWPARSAVPHLAYGFNLYADVQGMLNMGFDWLKGFPGTNLAGYPPQVNILFRFSAKASDLANVLAFGDDVYSTALDNKDYIDAYEIGNEVNIDNSDYGWGAPPNAADYKTLLCEAYARIKQADPTAIVVSAGLAPTGRVQGTWNGHLGHNGSFQDDREFLKELFTAGGGACLDAVGYHPYGFSADYDADPDVASADPTRNCDQGFCFRGVEKIYEIMQQRGLGDKKVWATEFGWITQPPDACLSDPTWQGRQWQIVSDAKQASNLVGAYQYADAHWPWMGGMFVFNLDFNQNPSLAECEQMRFYSIEGKPAKDALAALPKNKANVTGQLKTDTSVLSILIGIDEQPMTWTPAANLYNAGWQSLRYTATVDSSASVVPILSGAATGTLSATQETWLPVSVPGFSRTLGTYTGTVRVNWYAAGAGNNPRSIGLQMIVVSNVYRIYLPVIGR
ncbi:MAG TPA: hypothetical protein VMP08_00130 [Anaerolineae bacterium]|nr:hypothetical protein [Anaerolineae bacterium]